MRYLWWLPLIGALFGMSDMISTWNNAASAPQQAAGFASALTWAVVPYVFVKAIQYLNYPLQQAVKDISATLAPESTKQKNAEGTEPSLKLPID